MSNVEMTKALLIAIESGNYEDATGYLSDDFQFIGPVPEPVSGEVWLKLHSVLTDAFPDFSFNVGYIHETVFGAEVEVQITGIHQNELDLTAMGLPKIAATGKTVKLPVEHADITIDGDKITKFHVKDVRPDGGVLGILQQLGVEIPKSTE